MGRPGGGILACADTRASRARPTSRPCSTCCPVTCRCPGPASTESLDKYVETITSPTQKGFWANARNYTVSLLKSYWGDAATADNDFCFDYLPRLTGDHGTYHTVMDMVDDLDLDRLEDGRSSMLGNESPRGSTPGEILECRRRNPQPFW